mmetsp:Transcript_9767/g.24039  ORF Transcript_9767/g.24039 Transcript_9767/m.24039 type:complete len:191 (-) Transcript_9767:144-716(-)
MAVASMGARVRVTDTKPLLPLLRHNVDVNEHAFVNGNLKPEVLELYWGEEETYEKATDDSYEIVIGTQITDSEEQIPALLHILSTLVFHARMSGDVNAPLIYLASERSTRRGGDRLSDNLKEAADSGDPHAEFLTHAATVFEIRKEFQINGEACAQKIPQAFVTSTSKEVEDVDIHELKPLATRHRLGPS